MQYRRTPSHHRLDLTPLITSRLSAAGLELAMTSSRHLALRSIGLHLFTCDYDADGGHDCMRWLPDPSTWIILDVLPDGVAGRCIGPREQALDTEPCPGDRHLGAVIHPGFARRCLGAGLEQALGSVAELPEIAPALAASLRAELDLAAPDHVLLARFEQLLVASIDRQHDGASTIVAQTCTELHRANGQLTLGQLSERMGCSERHLRRECRHHVGMGPKDLMRAYRLRAVLETGLAPGEARSWSELATDFGFADQSHLIAECRKLIRLTPRELERELDGGGLFAHGILALQGSR